MIDYTVIRSRRRTLALEVTRQGTALVRAPLRASDADIARFVDSHRGWLEKHLAARQAYLSAHPEPSATHLLPAAGTTDVESTLCLKESWQPIAPLRLILIFNMKNVRLWSKSCWQAS